jgi:hypothetical protein
MGALLRARRLAVVHSIVLSSVACFSETGNRAFVGVGSGLTDDQLRQVRGELRHLRP